jgi:hypothetical protein
VAYISLQNFIICLSVCSFYLFNCLLVNLLNFFLQMHLLLPCLCKSRFNFYFLFSFFLSLLHSSFCFYSSFSFSPIISHFSSSSLHYLHKYVSMAVFNLHICPLLSFPILPLFTLLFTISSCLSTQTQTHTHTHTQTHKDRNGLVDRFYSINQPLWCMHMDHCWHECRRWHTYHNITP